MVSSTAKCNKFIVFILYYIKLTKIAQKKCRPSMSVLTSWRVY